MKKFNLTLIQQTIASLISWLLTLIIILVRYLFPHMPNAISIPFHILTIAFILASIIISLLKKEPYDELALQNEAKAANWTLFLLTICISVIIIILFNKNINLEISSNLLIGLLAFINITKNGLFLFLEKRGE